MSQTTQVRQTPKAQPLDAIEQTATRCLYCIDAAIKPSSSFLDVDLEPHCDFIEQVEALTPTQRLLKAAALVSELLLLLGRRQSTAASQTVDIGATTADY